MVAQDFGTLLRCQSIVGIQTQRLILDEILGPDNLPDIVIVGPDTHEQGVGPDRDAGRFREVCDVDRVRIGAGRLPREPPQERAIQVGQLEQRLARCPPGKRLSHW